MQLLLISYSKDIFDKQFLIYYLRISKKYSSQITRFLRNGSSFILLLYIIKNKINIMKKHLVDNNRLWDYEIIKQLGRGQYGHVYHVKSKKNNHHYALKKVNISSAHEKQKIQAFREIKALKLIRHPHLIEYYQSFLSMDNIYIVMQFAEKGDFSRILKERRKKQRFYTEDQLWEIFGILAQGVKHLHQKNIIHRDLKVENIFETKDDKIKIGDLGMAKILSKADQMVSTRVGTPIYFAPQIIQHQMYSFPVDVWALGCIFYYFTTLQHPFKEATIETLGYYIIDKDPKPIKGNYSPQLINFISSLLTKNPNTRPSIFQIAIKIKSKNDLKITNKMSVFNIKQLLLMKQLNLQSSDKKQQQNKSKKKIDEYMQDIKKRYQESKEQSYIKNPEQIQQNKKSVVKIQNGRYKNYSLVLPARKKRIEQTLIASPMIKSNGFSEQNRSFVLTNRKSMSIEKNSKQRQNSSLNKIDELGFKTAKVRFLGPVI